MIDQFLHEALRRLDARLLDVCDAEQQRAVLLAGDGEPGWDGVRNLVRPSVTDLADRGSRTDALLPSDDSLFRRVGKTIELTETELEVLLVLIAAYVEPRYAAIYAVLHDDTNQPHATERLLTAVLAPLPSQRAPLASSLSATGRLVRSGLVTRLDGTYAPLARPFVVADDLVAALLGDPHPAVGGATSQRWRTGTGDEPHRSPMIVVHGSGDRAAVARANAGHSELLEVAIPARPADSAGVAHAAWRVGVYTGAIPLLDLRELDDSDAVSVARGLHEMVHELGGHAWLLTLHPVPVAVPHTEAVPSSWPTRRDAWLAGAERRGSTLDHADAEHLASRHRLDGEAIDHVIDAAPSIDGPTLDALAASMGADNVRHSVRIVAERSFDDLVLRDTTLDGIERLVHFMRTRDRLADDHHLEHRYRLERGPIALFSGRSGTGKTLAAEAVAGELGRPLHTVDIANLMSKYIGESEKHFDEVLTEGERASAVMFFDEADSLFSNRMENASSGSEHFANMLVGYILQRIEMHHGLVILSTNLRNSIDDAFLRRFQFRIEFPLPDAGERRRIWELMLPPTIERAGDVDVQVVADAHRLAGGDIRNAALKAIFLAHQQSVPLAQHHLERAVALELLEMGRLSRRSPAGHGADGSTDTDADADRGELLRACLDDLHDQLDAHLRARFLKEIHLVHGSPTEDRLAGKRPAASIALFRLAARRGDDGLRAGVIVSAWASVAEEESELLGVLHQSLSAMSLNPVGRRNATLRVQESNDFDLLYRFWSSHDHPVRASIVVDIEIE